MVVKQLKKDFDTIFEHRGEELYFIKEARSEKRDEFSRRAPRRIASTYVWSVSMLEIQDYVDNDEYALISITY